MKHLLFFGKFERKVSYKLKGHSYESNEGCCPEKLEMYFFADLDTIWASLSTLQQYSKPTI